MRRALRFGAVCRTANPVEQVCGTTGAVPEHLGPLPGRYGGGAPRRHGDLGRVGLLYADPPVLACE